MSAPRPTAAAPALAIVMAFALSTSARAEEVKVMQDLDLDLYGNEYRGNSDSVFALSQPPREWALSTWLYADYDLRFQTPSGVSGQVLAEAQGNAETTSAALGQAWIKVSLGEGWGLTFGRHTLAWEDGGNWHPSDIVNNYLVWGQYGQAPGQDALELSGLIGLPDLNIDLDAATILVEGLDNPAQLPYYFKVGSILYPLDLKLKGAIQSGRKPMLGASASYALQLGSVYADALWLEDRPMAATFDAGYPSEGSWFRYCGGVQLNLDITQSRLAQSLCLQAEYLRQDDGLDASQMSDYFGFLRQEASDSSAYATAAGLWGGRFFDLGRDYAFASFSIGEVANEHIGLSEACTLNLDSLDFALASSLSWSPRNLFAISLTAINFGGKAGGEAYELPYIAEYALCLSKSF